MTIAGTDGIQHKAKEGKMIIQKDCLWVSYAVHVDNGMAMAADGFYEGSVPVTMPMMLRIKQEITEAMQSHLNTVKPVDNTGKLVMGVPKPKVRLVELRCVIAAVLDEEVPVN